MGRALRWGELLGHETPSSSSEPWAQEGQVPGGAPELLSLADVGLADLLRFGCPRRVQARLTPGK